MQHARRSGTAFKAACGNSLSNMESDFLSKLRPIHEPEPISWWPPAPGWWFVAILIPFICFLTYWLYRRITRKTAIKTAKKLLLAIKQDNQSGNRQKLETLSGLIRRVAISLSGRSNCAGLTGDQWLTFLDSTMKSHPFSQGIGKLLTESPYRNKQPTSEEIAQLLNLCESWLSAQGKRKR